MFYCHYNMFGKTLGLFVACALAIAQVSAAPAPVSPDAAAASPAPPAASPAPPAPAPTDAAVANAGSSAPKNRIVTSVSCDGGYTQTGKLTLGKNSVSVGGNGDLSTGGDSVQFTFTECTSSLMNVGKFAGSDDSDHYGRLTLASDNNKCLAAKALGENNAHIYQTDCLKSDDSGQFTQFWKLSKQGGNTNVEFLGHINDGRNPYVLGQDGSSVTVSPTGNAKESLTLSADKTKPSSKESVPNTANRVVASIKCQGGFTKTGALAVDGQGNLGLSGKPADLTVGGSDTKFTFAECTSQLLGNENFASGDASSVYGIIQVAGSNGGQCLRASGLMQKLAPIEAENCTYSDDSSQMTQFWEYNKKDNQLSFVGKASISGDAKYGVKLNDKVVAVSPDGKNEATLKFN